RPGKRRQRVQQLRGVELRMDLVSVFPALYHVQRGVDAGSEPTFVLVRCGIRCDAILLVGIHDGTEHYLDASQGPISVQSMNCFSMSRATSAIFSHPEFSDCILTLFPSGSFRMRVIIGRPLRQVPRLNSFSITPMRTRVVRSSA